MHRTGNEHQLFVVALEELECVAAQLAGVRLVAVDHQHCAVDLAGICEQAHVHQRSARGSRPTVVGVE